MPRATNKDKIFYKGVLLVKIHDQIVSDGVYDMNIDDLDKYLKAYADLEGLSCNDMNHEQMQILKEFSKQFAASIGMGFEAFEKNKPEKEDLDFNRTENN